MEKFGFIYKLPKLCDRGGDLAKDWYVEYYVRNPMTGRLARRQKRGKINRFDTATLRRKEAYKLIASLKRKLKAGWTPFNDNGSVYGSLANYADKGKAYSPREKDKDYSIEQILSESLTSIKDDIRERTFKTYQSQLRMFLRYLKLNKLDKLDIWDFDTKEAQKFLDSLKTLHSKTRKTYRSNLRRLFNTDLVKAIYPNPFPETKPIKSETTLNKRAFRKNEIEQIKAYCLEHEPVLWDFVQFIYYCFIRPNEGRQLKASDVDFENGLIWVRAEISKNKKKQHVVIPKEFLPTVQRIVNGKLNSDYLFPSQQKRNQKKGKCVHKNYFTKKHKEVLRKLGFMNDVSLYSWKHTGVVYFYKKTKDLKALQEQLRHSSLEITQVYLKSHLAIDDRVIRDEFPKI